jgi:uncharacterized protein (DUF433 family)
MARTFEPLPVPLRENQYGVIRVGDSRVSLDTVLYRYKQGDSPETIVENFPTLKLVDVYEVIAYYLAHQFEIDEYLAETERHEEELREFVESQPGYQETSQRLRASRDQMRRRGAPSPD